ncbi:unnamed protein product [Lupinus luteus]|uniref:Uncharacterized protein n=1 Tax=Lupinus luteus TaxID=3873 RepID=A0AAV1YFI8_LUPLU
MYSWGGTLLDWTVLTGQTRQSLTTPLLHSRSMRGMPRKRLYDLGPGRTVPEGTDRSIIVFLARKCYFGCVQRGLMDRNSTHIRGYHFTMSPEGQWSSDGYRYTYTGPCGLKVHMECTGSSVMIPHPDDVIDASFTLPLRRTPTPGGGVSFPPVQNDGVGPSPGRRTWPDVVDAPSSSRAVRSSGRGAGSCKKSPVLRMSSPPNYASGIWHHDMDEDDEEEDEVIELVKVESSVEVIDLVSDSEEEKDPSEGSSILGIF